MINQLKYLTIRGSDSKELGSLSLSPKTSDQVDNQVVLNALVATLVKYGQTGKIEPYLASSWDVSDNGLVWSFKIKSGFSCENGDPITAERFASALKNSFKGNVKKSDKTEFNKLEGWSEFVGGASELTGLTSNADMLILRFKSQPKDILNFFRMPYFGLWCNNETVAADFDIAKFQSSGAYKLKQITNSHMFLLEIRKDQPTYSPDSPEFVQVGTITSNEVLPDQDPVIYKLIHDGNDMKLNNYQSMSSPPAIFQGVVLHPNAKFFSLEGNRKAFSAKLHHYLKKQKKITVSPGMYLDSKTKFVKDDSSIQFVSKPVKPLRIAFQYRSPFHESNLFWKEMFEEIFVGIPFEIIYPDPSDAQWVRNMINNPDYDIRTAHVYAGTTYSLSTIKMMFCSDMGISFPDVNKKMCSLVDKFEKANKEIDDSFKAEFEEILNADATLFPVFHANDQWLISPAVSMESMPTSIIYPLFENIRFKK